MTDTKKINMVPGNPKIKIGAKVITDTGIVGEITEIVFYKSMEEYTIEVKEQHTGNSVSCILEDVTPYEEDTETDSKHDAVMKALEARPSKTKLLDKVERESDKVEIVSKPRGRKKPSRKPYTPQENRIPITNSSRASSDKDVRLKKLELLERVLDCINEIK